MFENELQTRAAICGTGVLIGLVFVLAHLPLILLILPIEVLPHRIEWAMFILKLPGLWSEVSNGF
jgi:hypothetical protein